MGKTAKITDEPKATDVTGTGTGSALATPPKSDLLRAPTSEELATLDELNAALGDAGGIDDGLSEVLATDLRTPLIQYNLKQAEGVQRISQDQFLDSISRSVRNSITCVFLDMHKTNLYAVYDNKDKRNVTMCSSYDRVTGTWAADGHSRQCKGCPDAVWRTMPDGKRVQPCSEIWNMGLFDIEASQVALIKFKRTALPAITNHIQAHHINRRIVNGRRVNMPLCAFKVRMTLTMDKSGNFAVPVIERIGSLHAGDIRAMHETAQAVRETFQARMQLADESAAGDGGNEGGAPDTSFDPSTFGGGDANGGAQRGSEAFVE